MSFFQDMSAYVKKIQFKLHESYGNPLRGEYVLLIVILVTTSIFSIKAFFHMSHSLNCLFAH